MHKIEAIIFDMDGVIIDSEPLHVQAEHVTCEHYGIQAPWSEWARFKGQTEYDMFSYIIQHWTDGTISIHDLIETKNNLLQQLITEKLEPIPGALDFIRWAHTYYQKLALTTSSEKRLQQVIFDRYNLRSYFDTIITGDDIQYGKPHPEPYIKTTQALQLYPAACVVIEDSINGILSAKEAGCVVAGITTSFPREKLLTAGADMVVDDFLALCQQLLRINN